MLEAKQNGIPKAPEVGQAVRVRNRLATVRTVEPHDTRTEGRLITSLRSPIAT